VGQHYLIQPYNTIFIEMQVFLIHVYVRTVDRVANEINAVESACVSVISLFNCARKL